jgi:tRNA modification GTPase
VEVPLRLPGGMVHLIDTAGLGRPVDGLDQMAMERTRSQGRQADVRIWIQDGTAPASEPPEEAAIRVLTKKDLPGFQGREGFQAVSNKSGEGLKDLLRKLDGQVFENRGGEEDVVLATERQIIAVESAREKVAGAYASLKGKPAIEIIAFEIHEAARHMQELVGEISTEEILQRVFAGFCIGK